MFKQIAISAPGLVAVSQSSSAYEIKHADSVGIACSVTASSPSVQTFADTDVDVGADQITISAHGYRTGLKVALTTSGALPTGLSATDYYVILNDGNTIQLATSAANAAAGTAVNITAAAGGGTHTLTPAAADMDLILQGSVDGTNFFNLVTTEITGTGVFSASLSSPAFSMLRARVSIAAGQATIGDVYMSVNEGRR